jgi:hypothetical protein
MTLLLGFAILQRLCAQRGWGTFGPPGQRTCVSELSCSSRAAGIEAALLWLS